MVMLLKKNLNVIYDIIVYWKKNLFMLPTGRAGKDYIDEITRLLNAWIQDSAMKHITFKAIMVTPSLILQKPSRNSKVKDHSEALRRRLILWRSGDLLQLFKEAETIQKGLKDSTTPKSIAQLSKKFVEHMNKGNINSAIKLLSNNMENGILPLNDTTLKLLKQKHPRQSEADKHLLFDDIPKSIHKIKYECIDAEVIRNTALRTRGGSGPSGMDADGWRRILTSNSFGQSSTDICIALANVAKKICVEPDQTNSLEAFLASRLIPLDKNPGLRPIGVGEVIRRIIGTSVIHTLKEDSIRSVGNLQVCAGHESGCEAAIHAMSQVFNEEDSEAVLLIDASNAFNAVNRKLFLHNVGVICPEIAVFVRNCYSLPSRLFIIGGSELKSCEGTTQGDPAAMAIYAIGIIPLLLMLVDQAEQLPGKKTKSVAYADDFTGAGSIKNLLHWWNTLTTLGPLFGYHPEPTKCWLIVKPRMKDIALKTFENTGINITEDVMRHLGAVIGTIEYRENYVTQKVNNWLDELNVM